MTFPTYGKSNKMFQTTNQSCFLPSTGFLPSNCLVFFTQFCELNPDKSYAWWSHVKPPWNNYIKPPLYHIISYYIIYHIISLFTTLSYIKPSISISIKYHEKPSNPLVMHWWSQVVSWTDKKDSFWDASIYIYTYIGQWEGLSHILWKRKNVWNHQPVYIYRTASFSIKKKQSFSIANCIFFPSRNGSTREASSGRSKSTSLVPWKSLVWEAVFGDFQWTIQKSPYTNNLIPVLCMYIYICNYMHVYT